MHMQHAVANCAARMIDMRGLEESLRQVRARMQLMIVGML